MKFWTAPFIKEILKTPRAMRLLGVFIFAYVNL